MDKRSRFALLAIIVLGTLQAMTVFMDSAYPHFPHFVRYFLFFVVGKVVGDVAYFSFWPERREWARFSMYLLEDFFTYFRFVIPLAIMQRWLETLTIVPPLYDLPPAGVYHYAVAGPYLAAAMYIFNRILRETSAETSYRQARNLRNLP